MISDGGDNASLQSLNEVMAMAGHSNAIMFMIGIFDENDIDRNPGVLKQFAKATGGQASCPSRQPDSPLLLSKSPKISATSTHSLTYLRTGRGTENTGASE